MKHFFRKIQAAAVLFSVFCCGCAEPSQEIWTAGEEIGQASQETSGAKAQEEALLLETASPSQAPAKEEKAPAKIFVDVCGAVNKPGVYELEEGERLFKAVEKAGGFTKEASSVSVNQAQLLTDGQQIYVPTKEEAKEGGGIPPVSVASGEESGSAAGKVDLNTADEAALETLTGIGPAKAKAILDYREENGPFGSIEELKNVEGIKDGTFNKIKDEIEVG